MKIKCFYLILSLFFLFDSALAADPRVLSGWEAHSQLLRGNARHTDNKKPGRAVQDLDSNIQFPIAAVLTCIDGRVSPFTIFDQEPGSLTLVRTLGGSVGEQAIAALEYAVKVQGVNLIVVLNAAECTGRSYPETSGADKNAASALDRYVRQMKGKELKSRAYISHSVAKILNDSLILQDAVKSGGLVFAEAAYLSKTGRVDFFEVGEPNLFDYRRKFLQNKKEGFPSEAPNKGPKTH